MVRRRPLATLTARLIVTSVALTALVCLLISVATTLAMRGYLTGRLDQQLQDLVGRDLRTAPGPGDGPGRYSAVGSIRAQFPEGYDAQGAVIDGDEPDGPAPVGLDEPALDELREIDTDGEPHRLALPDLGSYRVVAEQVTFVSERGRVPGVLVVGLPTQEVDQTVASLILWEALLTLLGLAAAGTAALVVVRRQLQPLREVAATAERVAGLPLAVGEIKISERVPERLTDEATEVGQVGASLNTLLAHVESSLAARQRSEQQVRQFVADASHELRTPLTTIKGYAELARRRPDDAAGSRLALDKVEQESIRMTALVEDLLLLARLDAGRPLDRAEVDLSRLLIEAVSDARVLAPGHRWRLDLPDDAMLVVGDDQRLHQVVTNLLTNARKHTPAGTTVTVTARLGAGVLVAVHDDGPGFPPELAQRAFERFVRGDGARTRTGDGGLDNGAGLGLSLVQAIVFAHGGTVWLDSTPGDTTVSIILPPAPRGSP